MNIIINNTELLEKLLVILQMIFSYKVTALFKFIYRLVVIKLLDFSSNILNTRLNNRKFLILREDRQKNIKY